MTVVYKSTTSDDRGKGRLKVDYAVTSNGDTATLTVKQTAQYYATTATTIKIAVGGLSVRIPADDFTNRTSNASAISKSVSTLKTWVDVGTVTKTVTVSQTHSNQTRTIGGAGIYSGGKTSASTTSLSYLLNGTTGHEAITVTIPPKTSYKVTLDANGGTGGTASLTKWYGETLSLTSGFTAPTRTGYKFVGWGETSTATATASQYTGNAAKTYYAVWEKQITGITLNVTTLRVADGTATAEADEGTWCYGTCAYSITGPAAADVAFTVSVTPNTPQIVQDTFTATKTEDNTLTGSFEFRASGCATDASYTFMVAAVAENTSATQTVTKSQGNVLSMAYYVMDVLGNGYTGQRPGHGIAFGGPCKAEGFHVVMPADFSDGLSVTGDIETSGAVDLSHTLTTQTYTKAYTAAANSGSGAVDITITKSGYTPLGIVQCATGSQSVAIVQYSTLNDTTARMYFRNVSGSAASPTCTIKVLYMAVV